MYIEQPKNYRTLIDKLLTIEIILILHKLTALATRHEMAICVCKYVIGFHFYFAYL